MQLFKRIILASFGMTILSIGIGFVVNAKFGSDILTLSIEAYQKTFPLSVGTYNFLYYFYLFLVLPRFLVISYYLFRVFFTY